MFKSLLKIQFRSMFESGKNKGKRTGISQIHVTIFAVVILAIVMAVPLVLFFLMLANGFAQQNLAWLYWSLLGIFSLIAGILASVFSTYQLIFRAKDNERLLAMPIPPRMILLVRVISLYMLSLLAELFILTPALIAFRMDGGKTSTALLATALFLLLPLMSMTISLVLAALMSFLGRYIPFKNFFALVAGIGGMLLYFYVVTFMSDRIAELLMAGVSFARAISDVAPPMYSLGQAISNMNMGHLLQYLAWVLLPFIAAVMLISHFFRTLLTRKEQTVRVEYKGGRQQSSPVFIALMKREVRRVLTLPMVLLNGGLGIIGSILIIAGLVVQKDIFLEAFEPIEMLFGQGVVGAAFIAIFTLLALSNSLSAASLSLEGHQLGILKSLPIASSDILLSKALYTLVVNHPPILLATIVYIILMPVAPGDLVLLFALPLVAGVFTSLLGVVINVYYPKLEWQNETQAVKQSLSIVLHMLAVLAIAGLIIVLYIWYFSRILTPMQLLLVLLVLFTILSLLLYLFIRTVGARKLDRIDA